MPERARPGLRPGLAGRVARLGKTLTAAVGALWITTGCTPDLYNAQLASGPYPLELHRPDSVDIQVFRQDTGIEIVNATAVSYEDVDVWINRRYTAALESLPAGGRAHMSLWDFYDMRGEQFNAGGLFAIREPTLVRLVELQVNQSDPLVGLITIRAEDDVR